MESEKTLGTRLKIRFPGNCPPTPPLKQHKLTCFSRKANAGLRVGVGGQFLRKLTGSKNAPYHRCIMNPISYFPFFEIIDPMYPFLKCITIVHLSKKHKFLVRVILGQLYCRFPLPWKQTGQGSIFQRNVPHVSDSD